ncbi:hypothetical protein HZS_7733, partial [Henneguya salminicola]
MVSIVLLLFESLPSKVEKIYKPFFQIGINLGILLIGGVSLYRIANEHWNLVHIVTLFLSLLLIIVLIFHPESPKYIFSRTRDSAKTESVFKKLRGKYYSQAEVELCKKSIIESSEVKQMSMGEFIKTRKFRLAIVSLIVLHLGQQLCGINAIMAFAPEVLKESGFESPDVAGALIVSIGLGGSIIF